MTDETFTEPADTTDEWVDVRMTDPDEGEWDIDLVVDGRVSYVTLRSARNSSPRSWTA
jgi:citrate lyase beta subunit